LGGVCQFYLAEDFAALISLTDRSIYCARVCHLIKALALHIWCKSFCPCPNQKLWCKSFCLCPNQNLWCKSFCPHLNQRLSTVITDSSQTASTNVCKHEHTNPSLRTFTGYQLSQESSTTVWYNYFSETFPVDFPELLIVYTQLYSFWTQKPCNDLSQKQNILDNKLLFFFFFSQILSSERWELITICYSSLIFHIFPQVSLKLIFLKE